jgi:hypothetical protein
MHSPPHLQEYMAEIRAQACCHCIERLPGAPPCEQLGKHCGIEMHLPVLVQVAHAIRSGMIDPYIDCFHETICMTCPYRSTSECPCPLDYLLPLAIDAIETVDASCSP